MWMLIDLGVALAGRDDAAGEFPAVQPVALRLDLGSDPILEAATNFAHIASSAYDEGESSWVCQAGGRLRAAPGNASLVCGLDLGASPSR